MRNLRGLMNMVKDSRREPTVEFKLTSIGTDTLARVRYDFTKRQYEEVSAEDLVDDILTLPSKVILKEELQKLEEMRAQALAESLAKKAELNNQSIDGKPPIDPLDNLEGCEDVISKEELRKLDSQPNPFNFSERDLSIQTDPPPSTSFCINVGPSDIYDAYQKDYKRKQEKERELEREKEKEKSSKGKTEEGKDGSNSSSLPRQDSHSSTTNFSANGSAEQTPGLFSYLSDEQLKKLAVTVKILERMVNQNIYDEILQDFKYWEDMSDEYKGKEGSLLPLWKFSPAALSSICPPVASVPPGRNAIRGLLVTDLCWSPMYPDLFAAAYSTAESSGGDGVGAVCLYSLKNPSAPERTVLCESGVNSVHFHPTISSLVAAGRADGAVSVFDVTKSTSPTIITSTAVGGKHLLACTQVRWIRTSPGEKLSLFSVALDGRVVQWHIIRDKLVNTDLLQFPSLQPTPPTGRVNCQLVATPSLGGNGLASSKANSPTSMTSALADTSSLNSDTKVTLEGTGTRIAFKPDNESILLIGCDTGVIFQCSTSSTIHSLTKYEGHSAPIRALAWNGHNSRVFLSASIDWSLKIWLEYCLNPLVVVDLGGPVADVSWAPYSSSIVVAATDDGKIHVFDFHIRKCRPLCVQALTLKKKVLVASVAISPFYPIILVAGDKGHLMSLKLSPNLRKMHKEAKGADEQRIKEIEISKIDRIIATNRG